MSRVKAILMINMRPNTLKLGKSPTQLLLSRMSMMMMLPMMI